jgi:serine protease SohB
MFGKNTDEDRAKLKEELEEVHDLFKALVAEHRPNLDVEAISTGEHWYGTRALQLGLIDELGSSDDYLIKAVEGSDVYHVTFKGKQTMQERIMAAFESSLDRAGLWLSDLQNQGRYR